MKNKAPETIILIRYLQECAIEGKTATFAEMSERLNGMDIQKRYRGKLSSALKTTEEEYGHVFESRTGIGYEPIQQSSIANKVTQKRQQRIVQQTNRWGSELKAVQPQKLSASEVKEYIKCQFKLAGQQLINGAKAQLKLEQRAEVSLPRFTGLEFAREAAIALCDVS